MTKRELFTAAIEFIDNYDTDRAYGELISGLQHEIELLDNRKDTPRKPTKVQVENETFKAAIVEYLTAVDAPKTIKEIQANVSELSELSNQKMTHLLTPLVNDGVLVKTYEKKTPFYCIAQYTETGRGDKKSPRPPRKNS